MNTFHADFFFVGVDLNTDIVVTKDKVVLHP